MSKNATPLRNIRVSDELWELAMTKAQSEGRTLSEVIREALESYTTPS